MTSQSRWRNIGLDAVSAVTLTVIAMTVYAGMFIRVPVLTEVRDFLFRYGWGASFWQIWTPSGDDYRPLSWLFFGWQQRLFQFDGEAVNLVQFILLGLGASFAYIHVRQLLGKRTAAFGASVFWLLSLPTIHAAFWQATQHDKLAFIFTLLALSVTFYAIRMDRLSLLPAFSAVILALVMAAVATKPIAFMIPCALVAQVILFTPRKTRSGYLRAGGLILIPTGYALVYALRYMSLVDAEWRAHTIQGDVAANALVYIRNVTNIDFDGNVWLAVMLFAPVAAGWTFAFWHWTKSALAPARFPVELSSESHIRNEDALLYFCAIFLGSIVILARARDPVSFYLLLPMFAFTASIATLAVSVLASKVVWIYRGGAVLVAGLALGLLITCYTNVTGQSRLGQWTRSARNLAAGYDLLRINVNPQSVESMTFYFPSEPFGYFYFFSDGVHENIDPAIPSFIFRKELIIPVENIFGEIPSAATSGELVSLWSDDLQLLDASLSGATIYDNPVGSDWPPAYVLGETLSFQKGEKRRRVPGNGLVLGRRLRSVE